MFKKLSLELGGKNAVLVFSDCDFERMVAETVRSSFSNQGQICLCGSRILVERSMYERFRETFVARVQKLRVGDPADASTDIGAVVSEAHMQKVLGHIELAKEEGGRILAVASGWNWMVHWPRLVPPHSDRRFRPACRTNQEEIFGPVVTIQPFDSGGGGRGNGQWNGYDLPVGMDSMEAACIALRDS